MKSTRLIIGGWIIGALLQSEAWFLVILMVLLLVLYESERIHGKWWERL